MSELCLNPGVKFTSPLNPLTVDHESRTIVDNGRTAVWYAKYYNFPTSDAKPTIAVVSFGGNYILSDLVHYWSNVCGLSKYPDVIDIAVGQCKLPPFTDSVEDMENTLCLEIAGAVCPNSTLLFISAPNTYKGIYQAFDAAINGVCRFKASIVSCSWGGSEINFGNRMMANLNSLLAHGANSGVTILASTGNSGSNNGYNANGIPNVNFPASCPWVTAIGGTTVTESEETAWSWDPIERWGTGSGFSSYFQVPRWQQSLVSIPSSTIVPNEYLKSIQCKRVIPDIALSANPEYGYTIYFNGRLYINQIGGTSCATPLMAGFLGLLDKRFPISASETLYSLYNNPDFGPDCYRDVESGNNDNVPTTVDAWIAELGFDNCSGIGSINGQAIADALVLFPRQ